MYDIKLNFNRPIEVDSSRVLENSWKWILMLETISTHRQFSATDHYVAKNRELKEEPIAFASTSTNDQVVQVVTRVIKEELS